MNDRANISLNYERMNAEADKIIEIAGRLNSINHTEFEGVLETLRTAWQGENAELFFNKSMIWQERSDVVREKLLASAQMIKEAASQYRAAELAALDLMEQSAGGKTTPT